MIMSKIRAFYVYLVVVFTLMIIVVDQNNRSKFVLKNLSKFTKKPTYDGNIYSQVEGPAFLLQWKFLYIFLFRNFWNNFLKNTFRRLLLRCSKWCWLCRNIFQLNWHICQLSSVIGGKLFFSNKTVFEVAQGLWDSETSDLNCSYEALVQK